MSLVKFLNKKQRTLNVIVATSIFWFLLNTFLVISFTKDGNNGEFRHSVCLSLESLMIKKELNLT